jgi:hypothetical protein
VGRRRRAWSHSTTGAGSPARSLPWLAAAVFAVTLAMKPEQLKARLLTSVPDPDRAVLAPLGGLLDDAGV